jgi:hypothetical protein
VNKGKAVSENQEAAPFLFTISKRVYIFDEHVETQLNWKTAKGNGRMKDNVGSYITTDVTRQHPSSWGYNCELRHPPKTPSRSCWRNGNNDSTRLKPEKLRNKQNHFSYFGF